jgi:uncharacterized protein YneF (UPF0154 family)
MEEFYMLYGVIGLAVGLVIGFFVSRYFFKRSLRKNPPINEKMIRAMFMEMGRKPNETQIKRIMKNINDQYK